MGGDFVQNLSAGTLNFIGGGLFSGNLSPYNVYISGAVNFGIGTVTIQNGGTFRINQGGYADINPFTIPPEVLFNIIAMEFTTLEQNGIRCRGEAILTM